MTPIRKQIALATLLAGLGVAALAQPQMPPQPGQPPMMRGDRGDHGPQMMQERMNRRLADLKQKLQITPAQEGAWNAWTQSMRPTARPQRPNMVEFARMTTPQRIDRMRELRNQRNAQQDRRADATKAFYSQLNAQQQKTFDEQPMHFMGRGGKGRHGGGFGGERGERGHYGR